MANMSYCRFTNTRADLGECLTALRNEEQLSDFEVRAGRNMFLDFLEFCEERDLIPSFDKAEVVALFNGLYEGAEE